VTTAFEILKDFLRSLKPFSFSCKKLWLHVTRLVESLNSWLPVNSL